MGSNGWHQGHLMGSHMKNKVKSEDAPLVPFEDQETEEIQTKLDKQLGPEYVSTRPGAGGIRVSYIEGWKAINLANQVFGFNGWRSEIKDVHLDYIEERNGKTNLSVSVIVRVTLKDGTYREDIGCGSIENSRTRAAAFEKARKEAMTDGLKRALRCFGNAMGNCLYDKEYLSKISKVKCAPPDFDETNLMRFTDNMSVPHSRASTIPPNVALNVPVQQPAQPQAQQSNIPHEPATSNTNFIAPQPRPIPNPRNQPIPKPNQIPPRTTSHATPNNKHNKKSAEKDNDDFDDSITFSDDINLESEDFNDELNDMLNTKMKTPAPGEHGEQQHENPTDESISQEATTNDTPSTQPTKENEIRPSQVSFVKARVAEDLQKNGDVAKTHAFNPAFISPSIRRTVDPTKSTPIKRTSAHELKTVRYDNPKLMPNRQIGKPRYPPPKRARVDSGKENNVIDNNGKQPSQENTNTASQQQTSS
ncbi:DNA repair and recombination protein [Wickerhamomyces ciferrii]|uniref:DNA repair and recombination protein RAD52 n=1 Tax=Wickerhamomyces ciferrii (strain ATCC 14091 / BCRC 22168 / CBS 111 / JCM 3599 / NBRC 0793 / NRRL Y-1031 F-60-10) TaxID=1206466 RepID=K0KFN7_WICCF|nr:DNA repair and recombination protein [Wickerhamomyces ciferrii]CCH43955.1 DNA repair and recombination protein [Wickerhamomyces ciferrii]